MTHKLHTLDRSNTYSYEPHTSTQIIDRLYFDQPSLMILNFIPNLLSKSYLCRPIKVIDYYCC